MDITREYEQEMRTAHQEYESLEGELRKEQDERDGMMKQI